MIKRIEINEAQQFFINCALDCKDAVVDFEYENFYDAHGYTSEEIKEACDDLREQLK